MRNLSRSKRMLLQMLATRAAVSTDAMIEHLWGDDPNGGPDTPVATLRTFLSLIRRHGYTISVLERGGKGEPTLYSMPAGDRAKARAWLDARQHQMLSGDAPELMAG